MLAIDVQQGVSDAWDRVATFAPKLAGFLVIVAAGCVIGKLLARVVDRVLERIGFDSWVERGVLRHGLQRARMSASGILAIVVFWAVFLLSLQLAFGVFGPNPVSDLLAGLIGYLPNVFVAVVIVVIAAALAKVVADVLVAVLGSVPAGPWIARLAGLAIVIFGVFAALDQLRIASAIATAMYFAALAVIVGVGIVAIGTGGMRTMREYWERVSESADIAANEVKRQAQDRAARLHVEEEDITVSIDSDPEWKPPRARGYELGAPSK
jgi:Mechanosensitive ion channel, conserved TM helix